MAAGYLLAPPDVEIWHVALVVILGGFMVNSFLSFATTNEFEIYHYGMGPTEARVGFIIINAYIAIFGTEQFTWILPLTCAICFVGLIVSTWQIHQKLWAIDMVMKDNDGS